MPCGRIRIVVPIVFVLVGFRVGPIRADLIPTQAGVSGASSDGSGDGSSDHYQTYQTNFVSGGDASTASGMAFQTRSVASVGLLGGDAGIHLLSEARTSNFSGYSPGSEALAAGQWEDVIRLGGDSRPDALLIHVTVSGNVQFSAPPTDTQYRQDARIGITNTVGTSPGQAPTQAAGAGGTVSEVQIIHADPSEGGSSLGTSNTDGFHYSATSGDIGWQASFLVSYDSSYGGYHFNLYASAYTRAIAFTDVTADFSHTFQLADVTNSDGSALSGPIAFDSGYQLASVPEPASLALLAVGAAGLGAVALRRARTVEVEGGRSRDLLKGLTAAALTLGCAPMAGADVIPISNTGVDDAGSPLPGGSDDPHWSIVAGPAINGQTPAQVLDSQLDGTYAQSDQSRWIWVNRDGTGATGAPYTFRMTIDLTGFDPSTATLTGSWGVDNNGSIQLNGAAAIGTGELELSGGSESNFRVFHDFAITAGFVSGLNTLDVLAEDDGNPAGLNVTNLVLTATRAAPEPASSLLLGLGVGVAGSVDVSRRIRARSTRAGAPGRTGYLRI